MPADDVTRHKYAIALCGEIRAAGCAWKAGESGEGNRNLYGSSLYADNFSGRMEKEDGEEGRKGSPVDTIFIGGGTPTTLEPTDLAMIMECVHENFYILPDAEITMEMNPGTFSEGMIAFVRKYVNRVSIGLQSALDEDLRMLGRIHTYQEFENCYRELREAGVSNINVDLMSAIPGQTVQDWEETLRKVVALSPEHISAYSLIIEEGTPFFDMRERGELDLPDEEEEREMYHLTKKVLDETGYHRYEISNYARAGYECRHNMRYWRREPYFGFGLGAASMYDEAMIDSQSFGLGAASMYDSAMMDSQMRVDKIKNGECRRNNQTDLHAYIERYGSHEKGISWMKDFQDEGVQIHRLTKEEAMEEFMFLGLRMTEGVSEQ
ncbi:MAG: radical SAM family heme chaperone HemW, partial [Lachnospiraceae bacterium]|nr:radical SAM family heme chaperone HemW [Lachnospiraceae bacterium]